MPIRKIPEMNSEIYTRLNENNFNNPLDEWIIKRALWILNLIRIILNRLWKEI